MKYLNFPEMDGVPAFTICQECFTPSIEFVLVTLGGVISDDFDDMVRQMDELQIRDFGKQDPMRPDIVEERAGLVCHQCSREGVDQEVSA